MLVGGEKSRVCDAHDVPVLQARRPTGLGLIGSAMPQTTSVKMNIARNTLWALCTAIPIQALRYRFVG